LSELFTTYVDFLLMALSFAIFGRVLLSWVSPSGEDPLSSILRQITEPILGPIRKVMPDTGMLDLTPMVALVVLNMLVRPILMAIL
tara:strand:+ start:118 stop:375 length:258 start_codon:yes stop_codon:yes gene_type:complete